MMVHCHRHRPLPLAPPADVNNPGSNLALCCPKVLSGYRETMHNEGCPPPRPSKPYDIEHCYCVIGAMMPCKLSARVKCKERGHQVLVES